VNKAFVFFIVILGIFADCHASSNPISDVVVTAFKQEGQYYNYVKNAIDDHKTLINQPDEEGKTPLWYAISLYKDSKLPLKTPIINLLLNNGADVAASVDTKSPLKIYEMPEVIQDAMLKKTIFRYISKNKKDLANKIFKLNKDDFFKRFFDGEEYLLEYNPDYFEVVDSNGLTPLLSAVVHKKEDDVELLLKNKVNTLATAEKDSPVGVDLKTVPFKKGQTALEIAQAALHNDSVKNNPEDMASITKIIKLLIDDETQKQLAEKAMLDTAFDKNAMYNAFYEGKLADVKNILDSYDKSLRIKILKHFSLLHNFLNIGNPEKGSEIITLLISMGADVNGTDKSGETPLFIACQNPNPAAFNLLLERGADYNAVTNNNETLLFRACRHGNLNIIKLLLDHGLNPNIPKNNGEFALFSIIEKSHPKTGTIAKGLQLAELLLKNEKHPALKADPNIETKIPTNPLPLMTAIFFGNVKLVTLLLDAGADPERKAITKKRKEEGKSPLEYAQACKDDTEFDDFFTSPAKKQEAYDSIITAIQQAIAKKSPPVSYTQKDLVESLEKLTTKLKELAAKLKTLLPASA